MSILIKNALLDEIKQDIFIEGNKIARIGQNLTFKAQKVINATGKAAIPSLINGHTHAAMTLLRGFADDMPLKEWLETKIWPMEAKLTQEDIYWGTRLAALEMIKSGTTFFNDMYWYPETAAKAVEDSGIRALINHVIIGSTENSKEEQVNKLLKLKSSTVDIGLGPHAIYTVPKEGLVWAKKVADQNNIKLHIHLSETRQEVIDCQKVNRCRPVEYLQEIGFLGPNVIAAHGVWLNDHEIKILKHHDVKIIHCPTSNMKLASGNSLPYNKLRENKISLGLGT
ncbi:MAG: amidohydrolase, partial [Nanoarchaeota archaeon]